MEPSVRRGLEKKKRRKVIMFYHCMAPNVSERQEKKKQE